MTDHKPDALVPSSRPGALRKAPTGDLVSRGLADLQRLDVVFPDKHLEAAVREALEKPDGPLTRGDLESLEELDVEWRGISDLTGLERCVNLTSLKLQRNQISDLTPLAACQSVSGS
jgi:Leucine-rich repeat (LRR) protein